MDALARQIGEWKSARAADARAEQMVEARIFQMPPFFLDVLETGKLSHVRVPPAPLRIVSGSIDSRQVNSLRSPTKPGHGSI
jgi:hypothetical protein